jgi:hypothetical protein
MIIVNTIKEFREGPISPYTNELHDQAGEVLQEYRETIESDCLGDMMLVLDESGIAYDFGEPNEVDANNTVRDKYRWAVVDLMARLLNVTRGTFEREVWRKERGR